MLPRDDERIGGSKARTPGNAVIFAVWLVLSAATIAVTTFVDAVSYYVAITLILAYTLVGYFLCFERNDARERELVMMSILCALAVVSRAVFIWVPFFKPMVAIIMIAGIGMGARNGFLVGVLAVLVSNLIFGQGPWTPWQMVSFGFAGMFIGALPNTGIIPRYALGAAKLLLVAALGALEVLLITGPVLDLYALVSMVGVYTPESVIGVLAAGLPVNAVQAAATFLTILILGDPILGALHRATLRSARPAL